MKINPLYVLPNLFTAASIFFAVFAIILAHNQNFVHACWFILLSMVLDGLDGRVARLTNTASKFGVEFDSLADVVAFGVAPAMVLYFYVGDFYGRYGIAISALFTVLGAVRLARFNISTGSEPNSFVGLPIPGAAATLVLWILFDNHGDYGFFKGSLFETHGYILLILAFICAILMVSNIRYPSFKKFKWDLKSFIIVIILLALIFVQPVVTLTVLMSLYVLYGIVRWIFIIFRYIVFKTKKH
ncbi:CDP-diacylglycerol--serine O-phosphatidyltransferase [Helicobacter sp. 13S00401-1]|uniref:CDP-diacylglycerol--serine O-phosphatidyltransferase n=1 Tax=Helicobacter sp. 13S00401-1 TaxID=1905758 RepID=UPI000BA54F7D|nr:CDP-diacylglycerol--serine O-phosphatidyltransferase [Helicobacter sp. 13S00401-1]PAF51063.1 CDP-diacylglycerol--serine O-phosphatidyltransferase [Helicobacter sp. 13S00401-1]